MYINHKPPDVVLTLSYVAFGNLASQWRRHRRFDSEYRRLNQGPDMFEDGVSNRVSWAMYPRST